MSRINLKATIKTFLVALVVIGLLIPFGSVFAGNGTQADCLADQNCISESGSTTVYPIAQVAMWRYPNTESSIFWVGQGGSGTGQSDVEKGLVDIGMSSSTCGEQSGQIYTCAQLDQYKIALDAITIVINDGNTCKLPYVTKWDIQGLYKYWHGQNSYPTPYDATHTRTYDIRYWDQFQAVADGAISTSLCPHTLIDIYARETTSGTRSSLIDMNGKFTCPSPNDGSADCEDNAVAHKAQPRVTGNPGMEAAVAGDTNGFGYVGLHFVDPTHLLAIPLETTSYGKTGTYPKIVTNEDANVTSGDYAMSRYLWMFSVKPSAGRPRKAIVQHYLDWMLQPEAQSIARGESYLPIAPTIGDFDVNMDTYTNITDIGLIGTSWGATNAVWGWIRTDANYDGVVNIGDVGYVGFNWGVRSAGQ